MEVQLKYLSAVREKTGRRQEAISLPGGSTLQDLVDRLNRRYGLSLPASQVMIILDGKGWKQQPRGMATLLREGQVVTLAPLVEGG